MKAEDIFTGERFVPGIINEQLEAEHMQRYHSMDNIVRGKKVLDAACGEGYGSYYLSHFAKNVTGVDLDEETIKRAKEKYADAENLTFQQGDIGNLSFIPDHSIDVVISFETIEHVPEEVQHKFLEEIQRVLTDDGVLVMSTPNKKLYSDEPGYHNEFHIKEFYREEFYNFLKKKFLYVSEYEQYNEVVSVIDSKEYNEESVKYLKDREAYAGEGMFILAIASNKEIPGWNISSVYMKPTPQYKDMQNRILTLQKEEAERNKHLDELDSEIKEKDKSIVELQREVTERNKHIIKLDSEIKEKDDSIVGLQQEITERNNHIKELDAEIDEKNGYISILQEEVKQHSSHVEQQALIIEQQAIRMEKLLGQIEQQSNQIKEQAEHIEHQEEQIQQKDEQIELLQQTIRNKEGHIELLLETERAYEREKNTKTYKLAKALQKSVSEAFPERSKRRFFLRVFWNLIKNPQLMIHVINPTRIEHYFKYLKEEGMSGVIRRYNEAEELERVRLYPDQDKMLKIDKVEEKQNIVDYEKLYLPAPSGNVTVSIVVPVYNEFHYTYNCIKSIIENSGDISYEVIIANDCSTDMTSEVEKIVENVRLVTTEKNSRFLLNCNNAAKYAKGKYILFLNNDTQVQKNWLAPLVELIERDESIGMVGSKLVYPDGLLQEAGGILWKDGSAWNYGHRACADDSEYNYVKEADYISGAAIMIRADLWNEIGGFDELFVPAYCEDSDLAFEVRKRGYKVMYQPLSVVVHFEGVSNGTDTNSGQKAYQVTNQQKFMEKWKAVLEKEHFPNAENVFLARDRSRNKPCLLMIDHYVPQFDHDAGSRTVFQYLKLFVEKGYNVKFIGDNFYRHEPYTTVLQQLGIEVLYGPDYRDNWKNWIKNNANSIDYVFLNRPHISENYIDFIKQNTHARIIYYGHDLHFLRERREYELTKNQETLKSAKQWQERELALMRKADMAYYPSFVEVNGIKKIDKDIHVKAITAYMFDQVEQKRYDFQRRKDIMFIGGFGHPPNADAVVWFVKEIYPQVLRQIPDMKFYVLGANPPDQVLDVASDNIIIKGFVTDEELERFYSECRLSVVPLRYGAGIKGKVIEAMHYGIPVITTSIGAEGISGAEDILKVIDDPKQFAAELCRIYNDEKQLTKMASESIEYVNRYYSEEYAWKIIESDFT